MRSAALQGQAEYGKEAKQYLTSFSTEDDATQVLKKTKQVLVDANIKLNKIASNNNAVMKAFLLEECAKELKDLELVVDPLPLQRALGPNWLQSDSFTFFWCFTEKLFSCLPS